MSQVKNTAKQVEANAQSIRVLPKMSPDAAMQIAENLRNLATKNHEQFVIKGRNAMLALMADVYQLYWDAKGSSDQGEAFIGMIKAKLKELGVEVRKSSPETSQLIRYICKDLDDKQVSIYGRSLAVAFKNGTASSGFVPFIENTEGGFAGVRDTEAPPGNGGSGEKIGVDVAAKHARTEKTITTIEVTDWHEDEEFRVLIAFRNDDDTASLKNARLSEEGLKAVLSRYEADKKTRNKPTKDEEAATNRLALQALEADAANAKTKRESIEAELDEAIANGNGAKCDGLRVSLKVAQVQAKNAEKACKTFKESIEAPAPA